MKRRPGSGVPRPGSRPASTPSTTVTTPTLLALALVLVTLAVYAQIRAHEFVSLDDGLYVTQNPHVRTGLSAANAQWAFTTGHGANWHPLTWLSHQLDVSMFGLKPGPMHLVSLTLHVLNTLLLFGLLRALTGAVWRSGLVAALFAVHPTHVESVAWVAERKDVLSAFFWFAATWMYVEWVRRPEWWRYAAALGLCALGLMAKPMVMTLPFTFLLLDWWPLARTDVSWTRKVVEKLPFLALVVVSAFVTVIVQERGGAVGDLELVPVSLRITNAVVSYAAYLGMLVWPTDLAVFYPYVMDIPTASVIQAGVLLLAITAGAWLARRTMPFLLFGWLWFLGTMVPVIGLVQVGMQSRADRFTYVPYVGLFIGIAWTVRALATRVSLPSGALRVAGTAIVLVLAWVARDQAATWVTNEGIWLQAAAVTKDNVKAHNALGAIYGNEGRHDEAEIQFRAALRAKPDLTDARDIYPNLGRALLAQQKFEDALSFLDRARELNPLRADIRKDLCIALFALQKSEQALEHCREAVRMDPNLAEAHLSMGFVLAGMNQFEDARRAFREVLRINPSRQDARDALAALIKK